MRLSILMLFVTILCTLPSYSYPAYILGKQTYPGCDTRNGGNSCVIKIELPGPPAPMLPAPSVVVNIDQNTITHVSGVIYVAAPADPNQLAEWSSGAVILSVWYTSDDSPCPIPD